MAESLLASDSSKNTAVFINDFDQEFADALQKLSKKLKRPLKGVILVDKAVAKAGKDVPDKAGIFERIICDFSDDRDLKRSIRKFEDNVLLVTCSAERNQQYLKKLLPHIPYVLGPTETSLEWSTHKAKMRHMLTEYDNSLVPKAVLVETDSEAQIKKILNSLTFPLIIKPTGLASSTLVRKVNNVSQLQEALIHGFKIIDDIYERDSGRGNPAFIIEEFIEGQLYSTDVYINQAGGVRHLPLLRVETGYSVGEQGFYTYHVDTELNIKNKEVINAAQQATEKAVRALGLRSCVAHVELFHTPNGWKVVELGPRAGGERQDIYALAYGVDHAYNEFLIKIGLEPEIKTKLLSHTVKENIMTKEEGEIVGFEGFTEAKNLPSVTKIVAKMKLGDYALLSENGGKVIIAVVLSNIDKQQLMADVQKVRSLVRVVTR